MSRRNLILMTFISLTILALAACGTSLPGMALNASPTTAPALVLPSAVSVAAPTSTAPTATIVAPTATSTVVPTVSAPAASGVSGANSKAIQSVIQKANQEQAKALAAQDPTIMQDTATTTYYQQAAQNLTDMIRSGISSIELVNLQFGAITMKDASTAEAKTTETWSTSFADGGVLKETDPNVYTVVLQNGTWKVQDDQHPDAAAQQTSATSGGATPNPTAPVGPIAPSSSNPQSQSRNWSGYNATGGKFTSVSSTWTVPNVNASTSGVDATWVGIGGVTSTDLIQAGTEADVNGGQVSYSAWWETLPQSAQTIPMNIHAGDTIHVSIAQQADGTFLVSISDSTNSQLWQKSVTYDSSLSSAEWVEEAPMVGRRTLAPLDEFGSITFVNAVTTENGQTRTIAQAGGQPITMKNAAGQALAQTTSLTKTGDSFSIIRSDVSSTTQLGGRSN